MISVTFIGNRRVTDVVSGDTIVKEAMEAHNLNWATNSVTIGGAEVGPEELNMTFDELGITDHCTIVSIARKTNA